MGDNDEVIGILGDLEDRLLGPSALVRVADAIDELAKRTIDGDTIRERREARDRIKEWCRFLKDQVR